MAQERFIHNYIFLIEMSYNFMAPYFGYLMPAANNFLRDVSFALIIIVLFYC